LAKEQCKGAQDIQKVASTSKRAIFTGKAGQNEEEEEEEEEGG
jgi:hypothetical protein